MHAPAAASATAVIATLWSVFAVANAAAFIADVSPVALTAVQLACAAPIFHYMRGGALNVAPDDLIDTPFVIRDALGIRARPPAERPATPTPGRGAAVAGRRSFARARAAGDTPRLLSGPPSAPA